ncbi:hypothetical protein [Maridesulfovibrio sp.]|uniref:hypothetical protein n=1 Tax=Maridesulfovibrio sp. TaxID=2795000 RepID=UPI003BAC8E38
MLKAEFYLVINELYDFFQASKPDDSTLDRYYNKLKDCSLAGIKYAADKIIDEQTRLNRGTNVYKLFRQAYSSWTTKNPREATKNGCTHCDYPGFLVYWTQNIESGLWEMQCCPCAHCHPHETGAMNRYALEQRGYEHSNGSDWTMKNLEMKQLNREIRETINFEYAA